MQLDIWSHRNFLIGHKIDGEAIAVISFLLLFNIKFYSFLIYSFRCCCYLSLILRLRSPHSLTYHTEMIHNSLGFVERKNLCSHLFVNVDSFSMFLVWCHFHSHSHSLWSASIDLWRHVYVHFLCAMLCCVDFTPHNFFSFSAFCLPFCPLALQDDRSKSLTDVNGKVLRLNRYLAWHEKERTALTLEMSELNAARSHNNTSKI